MPQGALQEPSGGPVGTNGGPQGPSPQGPRPQGPKGGPQGPVGAHKGPARNIYICIYIYMYWTFLFVLSGVTHLKCLIWQHDVNFCNRELLLVVGAEIQFVCCVTQQELSVVSHSRHDCRVTRQTCPPCHAADVSAVSRSRCVCCITQQTCLLCHTADTSAVSHSRHS